MSRGPGSLQRRLLAELREHGVSSVQKLCARIFRQWPVSDANYSAARRAMRGLMRRGLVVEALPRKRDWCRGRSDSPTWQNQYVLQPDADCTSLQRLASVSVADVSKVETNETLTGPSVGVRTERCHERRFRPPESSEIHLYK